MNWMFCKIREGSQGEQSRNVRRLKVRARPATIHVSIPVCNFLQQVSAASISNVQKQRKKMGPRLGVCQVSEVPEGQRHNAAEGSERRQEVQRSVGW